MSNNNELTVLKEQDRRAALRESLPGLFFGIFVLVVCLGTLIWFLVK